MATWDELEAVIKSCEHVPDPEKAEVNDTSRRGNQRNGKTLCNRRLESKRRADRKYRQKKKELMKSLKERVEILEDENVRLKMKIQEYLNKWLEIKALEAALEAMLLQSTDNTLMSDICIYQQGGVNMNPAQ